MFPWSELDASLPFQGWWCNLLKKYTLTPVFWRNFKFYLCVKKLGSTYLKADKSPLRGMMKPAGETFIKRSIIQQVRLEKCFLKRRNNNWEFSRLKTQKQLRIFKIWKHKPVWEVPCCRWHLIISVAWRSIKSLDRNFATDGHICISLGRANTLICYPLPKLQNEDKTWLSRPWVPGVNTRSTVSPVILAQNYIDPILWGKSTGY